MPRVAPMQHCRCVDFIPLSCTALLPSWPTLSLFKVIECSPCQANGVFTDNAKSYADGGPECFQEKTPGVAVERVPRVNWLLEITTSVKGCRRGMQ